MPLVKKIIIITIIIIIIIMMNTRAASPLLWDVHIQNQIINTKSNKYENLSQH